MEKISDEELLDYISAEEKGELVFKSKKREYLNKISNYIQESIGKMIKIQDLIEKRDFIKIDKECKKVSRTLYRVAESMEKLPCEMGIKTNLGSSYIEDEQYIKFELLPDRVMHLVLKDSLPQAVNYNKITQQQEIAYYDFYKMSYLASFAKEFENGRYIYYDEKVVIYIINHYITEIDIDNYYYKYLIDSIKTFLLPDDSPKWCSMYTDAIEDERRYAEVYIVPYGIFPDFICQISDSRELHQ